MKTAETAETISSLKLSTPTSACHASLKSRRRHFVFKTTVLRAVKYDSSDTSPMNKTT